eukprot:NODE_493_length_7764_cov_0.561644.p6 type:complete len:109 gc:universal NODE_493_length_7764_cov_0.561644:3950-4276(+)
MFTRQFSKILRSEIKYTEKAKEHFKFQKDRENHADKLGNTWKKISLFFCAPVIVGTAIQAYVKEKKHLAHFHKQDTEFDYLYIRKKPFPWGDGRKSFFHSEEANHIKE